MSDERCDVQRSDEVIGSFVVSSGDAAEVLQAAEHALDGVAALVEKGVEASLPAPVCLGGDVGKRALVLDKAADRSGVIGLVGRNERAVGQMLEGSAAWGASAAFPPVRRKAMGRPTPSLSAWTLVFRPPRLTPIAWRCAPLFHQRPSDGP